MPKFIKEATAWKNRRYQDVFQECGVQLTNPGYFRKDAVCAKAGYPGDEDTMQWDFIINWLQDPKGAHGLLTVPVAERFWKDKVWNRAAAGGVPIAIGRYIATGHGKKTVGYVKASFQGGEFLLWQAQHKLAQRNGKTAALKRLVGRAKQDPAIAQTVQKALPTP